MNDTMYAVEEWHERAGDGMQLTVPEVRAYEDEGEARKVYAARAAALPDEYRREHDTRADGRSVYREVWVVELDRYSGWDGVSPEAFDGDGFDEVETLESAAYGVEDYRRGLE